MQLSKIRFIRLLLTAGFILSLTATGSAQVSWPGDNDNSISIDASFLKTSEEKSIVESANVWSIVGNFRVNRNIKMIFDIPIAQLSTRTIYHDYYRYPYGTDTASAMVAFPSANSGTMGNPFFGIGYDFSNLNLYIYAGFRIPLMSNEAGLIGFYAPMLIIDRMEAFSYDNTSYSFGAGYDLNVSKALKLNFDLGYTSLENPTYRLGIESFVNHSACMSYITGFFTGSAGYFGRSISGINDSHRYASFLNFETSYTLGNISPGLSIRIPIDEDSRDAFDFYYGLRLDFALNFSSKETGR